MMVDETVVVTGSRIVRDGFDTPSPVTVLDSTEITSVGATNLGDFLARVPSTISEFNNSDTVFSSTASAIQSTALRNLESHRTLVLVNGRRFVSGLSPGVGYAVDLNAIPTSVIERIEILTGGASAIYGSDAVAGVINIITKTDFEGLLVDVQYADPEEGGGERTDVEVTLGTNFDRGNAWVALKYSEDKGLAGTDRSFSGTDIAWYDPGGSIAAGSGWDWLGSSFPPAGRFGSFLGDGSPYRSGLGDEANSDRFNRASYRDLVIPIQRRFVNGGLSYDLADNISTSVEFNYAQVQSSSTFEPFPLDLNNDIWNIDRGGTGGMDVNSPLIPDLLRSNLLAAGTTNLNQLGLNNTARRLVEFGGRGSQVERVTFRVAADMEIDFDNGVTLNTFFTWGKTDVENLDNVGINRERAALALDVEVDPGDASGNTLRCVSAAARLAGCVPFNIFGAGTISDAAVDYLKTPQNLLSEIEQFVVGATLTGNLGVELPGGTIAWAGGLEYREESGNELPDAAAQAGITTSNRILPTDGEFDVKEAFVEFELPVHEYVIVDLAYRLGDYSTVGSQSTWKVGLDVPFHSNFRARATLSESVRAPNIADLFGGAGETFATFTDSCDGITNAATGNVAENCRSIPAIQRRIDANGTFVLTQVEKQSTGGFTAGNPDVKEETADAWTVGLVFTPDFAPDWRVSIDYYDIEIDNAITVVDRGTVVRRCFEASPGAFTPNCNGQAIRDPATGALTEVNSDTANEEILRTKGFDLEFDYQIELADLLAFAWVPGLFSLNVVLNHIYEYEIEAIESGIIDVEEGEVEFPDNRAWINLAYTYDKLDVNWRVTWVDETVDSNSPEARDENSGVTAPLPSEANTCDAVDYHDLHASYHFNEDVDVYGGINNAFEQDPCILGQLTNYGPTGINTAPSIFDVRGRDFYIGFRARF